MKININTQVSVKLTEYGFSVWKEHLNKYSIPYSDPPKNFMLWELMQVFDTCLFMGNVNIPFKNNEIEIQL